MSEGRTLKKIVRNILEGNILVRKPRKRWKDDVENVT
jgi:hypothetical protein